MSMTARPARLPFGTRFSLVVTVLFLVASWFGITTASAVGSLGPHRALYEVTATPTGVVDLGPLGTLEVDSPLPLRLGVRVTVQEIPAESTAVGAPASLERLSGDLDRYVQFFTSPVTFLQDAALDLVRSAFVRSMVALAVLGAVVGGIYALVGAARRRELAAAAVRRRRPVLAGVLALTVLGVGFLVNPPLDLVTPGSRPASAIFEGTPLEGARITGRLAGLVDTYGAMALDAYRENEEFYAGAEESLRMAWQQREEQSEGWQDLLLVSGRFTPLQRAILEEPDSLVTAVVVSDLHCNVGMAPVIQAAVELSGAEVVLDLGDTSVNGTQVERYCVTAFMNAFRAGGAGDVVFAGGNHDSELTADQVRAAGGIVLDGQVVTVRGIDMLGDADPLATRIGQGTSAVRGETPREAGERLAQVACEREQPVPLLLVHTPFVGDATLERGCALTQLSGHMHTWRGPQRFAQGVRLVSGSTAGAVSGQPTVGPLGGTATIGVLRISPEHGLVVDYQKITVEPDGTAEVGWRMPFPVPAGMLPPPVDENLPPGAV